MADNSSNNKRIAKNTLMLYVRMFLMMAVTLYTSRVVLQQLGIEDFGVYNVVGGAVALLGFLNASMSGATSRFLPYDIGKGDYCHLQLTFSSAMQIHLMIALAVLIFGEIVGIWFVNSCLDMPEGRVFAANVVFQFALLSSTVSIAQVPYSATLIAFERIDLYAWIEILNVFLKLGIVYVLSIIPFDKLESYSILIFIVSVVVLSVYVLCCKSKFSVCKLSKQFHKDIMLPMLFFSGWDLYGNGCVVLRQQGTNILLNQFFGVAINAASGVATQVSSAVSMFVSNITMAIRPQIIKQYAAGNIDVMQKLVSVAIIICVLLTEFVMVPIYLNIETIMNLWLVEVPSYAVDFSKALLIANSVNVLISVWNIVVHASGRIRILSIVSGSLYLVSLLFIYVALKLGANPNWAYYIWIVIVTIALLSSIIIAKSNIRSLSLRKILKGCLLPVLSSILSIVVVYMISLFFENSISKIFVIVAINMIILIVMLFAVWLLPCFGGNLKKAYNSYLNEN